jgi:hypothetical protein
MTLRVSSGLRNHILTFGSLKHALQNGELQIWSGTQPGSADYAPTGTLLSTITAASAARTAEVQATGSITLTGGSAGSINTLTVNSINLIPNGAVDYNTSLNQTAADLAAAINANVSFPDYYATASGAVVTIYAPKGLGAGANAWTVTATLTTITATYANMSGGVSPANGLRLGSAAAGVITKDAAQTWTGVNANGGTAGWFRFVGSVADSTLADSEEKQIRLDGSVSTSGADLNLTSTTLAQGATQTISAFQVTMPAS